MSQRTVGTLTYTAGGLLILFCWLLLGDFAYAMRDRAVGPSVLELLRQHRASDTAMTLLTGVLPAALGIFLGPLVSYRSDRYRSRWGRRLPFLLVASPVCALAMAGIGFCPWLGAQGHRLLGASSPGLDACILGCFCLCWTVFECAVIVTMPIFSGLINDVVPAALLGRFYGCFRIVSLGAGIFFNYWIFQHTETHLREIFLGVGLFFGLGFTIMCWRVREGEYPAPRPEAGGTMPRGFVANARIYLVECFAHPYYLWIFAALMVAALAFNPFNSFSQWYSGALGMPKETLGRLTALSYGISIFLAFFIGWLVDRFSAIKVAIVVMALFLPLAILGFCGIRGPASFGLVYVLHTVLSGAYFTATASLPMVLFPRLRFTQFASASGLAIALSNIAMNLVQGPILDWSGHNYRLTLLAESVFAALALFLLLVVRRNWLARQAQAVSPAE